MADVEIRSARDEDLEGVYEIVAENRRRVFGSVEGFELEHLRNLWPLLRDNWIARSGDWLVGASALTSDGVEVDVRLDARRGGVGTRLLRVAEGAAGSGVLRGFAATGERAAAPFLRANGYEKAAEVWLMGIDLVGEVGAPAWPAGVGVRTFREDDARAVRELLDLAYAEDPSVVVPPLRDWRRRMLGDPSFDADSWLLAEAEGRLVGAALCWNDGYVKDLVSHPAWRRRGLGGALMREVLRHFRARGAARVELKTDSVNPTQAWRLYERVGMRKKRTYEVFEKRL